MKKNRCFWVPENDELYARYHDEEWGVPLKDECALFELLVLESMQAGLSWRLILSRREDLRRAFASFDPKVCANFTDEDLDAIMEKPGVIRHRKKVEMVRTNARAYLDFDGKFSDWIWSFVNNKPIVGGWKSREEVPCETALSHLISKELKKRGFTFVGPKIVYSFCQAAGLVDDHTCKR